MNKHDNGGQAFPSNTDTHQYPGMSLRDWFAGMALQGILSNQEMRSGLIEVADSEGISVIDFISQSSFAHADSMLKERSK